MTREDILKELELWPLWTLKHALPTLVSAPEVPKVILDENVENIEPLVDILEAPHKVKAYESEDGRCLMLHATHDFTQEEATLWSNICKAMHIQPKLIQSDLQVKDLLNTRTPVVLILFGEEAAQTVLQSKNSIDDLRGAEHVYQEVPAIVTYDLKHLLQQLQDKGKAWNDLRMALKLMAR